MLAYLNQTPFGVNDPFFGKDVGFYIFSLPFMRLLQQHLWVAFLAALAVSALAYFILATYGSVPAGSPGTKGLTHISVLSAVLFVLRAWGYQISIWDLMYSPCGLLYGASYVDIHAQVPAFRVLISRRFWARSSRSPVSS